MNEVWIVNSEGQFLIMGRNCLRQCGREDFEVVESGRNPECSTLQTGRESSGLRVCPGSHEFFLYPVVRKRH